MHQCPRRLADPVPRRRDPRRLADERQRREALEERRGALFGRHAVGEVDDLGGGDGGQFGVGFVGDVADAVAGGEGGGGGSEDDAGGFFARDEGEGGFVEARAEVAMGDGVSLVGLGRGGGRRTCQCS